MWDLRGTGNGCSNNNHRKQPTTNFRVEFYTYITVVGGGHNILELLSIENVNGNKVAFRVPVLPGHGSGDLNNLQHKTNELKHANSKNGTSQQQPMDAKKQELSLKVYKLHYMGSLISTVMVPTTHMGDGQKAIEVLWHRIMQIS
jgi:hypothetical protein